MTPSILSLATSVPEFNHSQTEYAQKLAQAHQFNSKSTHKQHVIFAATTITKRHSVLADFGVPGLKGVLFGQQYPVVSPSTARRNQAYIKEAPKLAYKSAKKAIDKWGGDVNDITHIISVSCTGFMAPGIEFLLINDLGLSSSISRLGINFMGCFGAFNGIRTAKAIAQQNPEHRILLVCTELCSLHVQSDASINTMISNALFADGSASAIIGCVSSGGVFEITVDKSLALADSRQDITWECGDYGYLMGLSKYVPAKLRKNIQPFVSALVKNTVSPAECDWALHPGGKSILAGVEKACGLTHDHTQSSWHVFRQFGNMSSPTFLFVLEELLKHKNAKPWVIGLGFGPGISIEGVLLKRHV